MASLFGKSANILTSAVFTWIIIGYNFLPTPSMISQKANEFKALIGCLSCTASLMPLESSTIENSRVAEQPKAKMRYTSGPPPYKRIEISFSNINSTGGGLNSNISMSLPDNKPNTLAGSDMNGNDMPWMLEPLHFNCRALHLAFATMPLQLEQLPSQEGLLKVVVQPLCSRL
jgi:hypothetical protein